MNNGIELLPGEKIVLSTDKDTLVLTNMRVRHSESVSGREEVVSITLDAVASVALASTATPLLLVAAAIAGLAGLAGLASGVQQLMIMLVLALVLVLIYLATRKKAILIGSNGGRAIVEPATGLSVADCMKFINAIEREKLAQRSA